jgi:hypothetical protein
MGNTILNPSVIAKELVMRMKNRKAAVYNKVFRGYEKEWMEKVNGFKKGASITAKAPIYARVKDGETIDVTDIREEDVTLSVDQRKHVAYNFTGTEMTLNINEFGDVYLNPVVDAFEDYIATDVLGLYKYFPNQVGVPGSTPSDTYTIGEASAVLNDHGVPQAGRHCFMDSWASVKIADQLKGLSNSEMVRKAIEEGAFSRIHGFNLYPTECINSHTCGTAAGATTLLVDDTVAEGAVAITIDENGSWSKTFKQGDIFSVASVNGVHLNGQSMGRLRQFCVEADVAASGTEQAVSCTPGVAPFNIYSAAADEKYLPYQTVDALPANNAAVTCMGSSGLVHKVNMAFQENAIALFMVPVVPPQGLEAHKENADGFTITVCWGGDIKNYVSYIRFDILYGRKVINPFAGCRIAG